MNRSITALLVASLAGPVLSGSVLADPGYPGEAWIVARKGGDQERQEEQDLRKLKQQPSKKKQEQAESERERRGYGYGYERRNPDRYDDSRGRR